MSLRATPAYDFANVLFAGPCNRSCPWCIGKQLPAYVNENNLDVFPPRGLDAWAACVDAHAIREVVFTGTVSDPQLYRHEKRLLEHLRARLHADTRFSVHTNGVVALKKLETFNAYDRACISFPSFEPDTYQRMMGSRAVPDLAALVRAATIPVKVSCVLDTPNVGEVDAFLAQCAAIGVKRVVLRTLFGDTRMFPVLSGKTPTRWFKGNPVFDLDGLEVTLWNFDDTRCQSVNLFPDGTVGTSYLLTETAQLSKRRTA